MENQCPLHETDDESCTYTNTLLTMSKLALYPLGMLKVSKSQKQIMISRILPRNERNTLRIVSWVSFVRFWKNQRHYNLLFEIY